MSMEGRNTQAKPFSWVSRKLPDVLSQRHLVPLPPGRVFCATLWVYWELRLPKLLRAQRTTSCDPPQLRRWAGPATPPDPLKAGSRLAQRRTRTEQNVTLPAPVHCSRSSTTAAAQQTAHCRWSWDKACAPPQVRCFRQNKGLRPSSFSFLSFLQREQENGK